MAAVVSAPLHVAIDTIDLCEPHVRSLSTPQKSLFSQNFHAIYPVGATSAFCHSSTPQLSPIVYMALDKACEYLLYSPSEVWLRALQKLNEDELRFEKVAEILDHLACQNKSFPRVRDLLDNDDDDGDDGDMDIDNSTPDTLASLQAHKDAHQDYKDIEHLRQHSIRLPSFSVLGKVSGGINEDIQLKQVDQLEGMDDVDQLIKINHLGRALFEQQTFVPLWYSIFCACNEAGHAPFESSSEIQNNPHWIAVCFVLVLGVVLEVVEDQIPEQSERWQVSCQLVEACMGHFSVTESNKRQVEM